MHVLADTGLDGLYTNIVMLYSFFPSDQFFITLNEGSAEDNACFASAKNVYVGYECNGGHAS